MCNELGGKPKPVDEVWPHGSWRCDGQRKNCQQGRAAAGGRPDHDELNTDTFCINNFKRTEGQSQVKYF